ncbi:MAG: H+-ATPase G subunit-domain-containing protein [Piptocephalis tieghemiana]|nr:MAG: H+-ATPase G subunit-domain-containing protein [Piptocephalis tieghemiana]
MASNSQGIQTLLEAEKEASKIVAKARQYRVQRLKDARTEASKEIEELKARRASEFQHMEQGDSGSADAFVKDLQKDTQEKIDAVRQAYDANNEKVISFLLNKIIDVEAKVHPNAIHTSDI